MAVDMYLKLPDIPGESKDHKHKDEIEVLSYSWGMSQSGSLGGGGGGAGRVQVKDFTIVKQIDKSSPKLMEACCTGQHIGDATVTLSTQGRGEDFFRVKMSDCLISSYQTSATGGGVPAEQITITFGSVQVQAADRSGQFVSDVSCNFGSRFSDGQADHEH